MPGGIHAPVEEMLKWPTPNYTNPTLRPNTILVMACVLGPITFVMLMARLWVRLYYQRNAGWDDWLVVPGTILTIMITVLFPLATATGFERHIWDTNLFKAPEKVVISRKYILAILCIFSLASGLVKISILLFYRRLSTRVVSKRFRWATWLTIGFIASSTIAFTLAPIFGCNPISAFWDQVNYLKLIRGYEYHCFDEGADVFAASVISTIQDLITAVLPTFLYWNLRIPMRQKIALFGIFAIGYGVDILGAMRAFYTWNVYYETYDVTWHTYDVFIVTMLELHVGCFCANAPTLKVFFKHFFQETMTSSAKRSNTSGQRNELYGTQSSKSSASMLKEKFSGFFSKGNSTHSREGYLSGSHGDVTVDALGGVQVRRSIHVLNDPADPNVADPVRRDLRKSADTTEMQYYDDIEMGHYATGPNSHDTWEETTIEALPAMPQAARSPRSMKSSVPFHHQIRLQQSSADPERPVPATIAEEGHDTGSR